jgi:hypothetical protein
VSTRKDERDALITAVFVWMYELTMTSKVGDTLPTELEAVRNAAVAYRQHETDRINQRAKALNIYGRVGA